MAEPRSETTEIGCPACAGVLTCIREGEREHLRYACTVGHQFSARTLMEAKENQLETVLWSAVSLLAHVEMIGRALLDEVAREDIPMRKERFEARIRQAHTHREILRDLIEQTQPAMFGGDPEDAPGAS